MLDLVLGALPSDRQNVLFSATLLDDPQGGIAQDLKEPFRYSVRHGVPLNPVWVR